jgi:hypothetical protein
MHITIKVILKAQELLICILIRIIIVLTERKYKDLWTNIGLYVTSERLIPIEECKKLKRPVPMQKIEHSKIGETLDPVK